MMTPDRARGEVEFAADLYRGTASYYDRFRVGYPPALIDDLIRQAQPSSGGRLIDVACGGFERVRTERPDEIILDESGFELLGTYRFPNDHEWTSDQLVGFAFSTSVLGRAVLGDLANAFVHDLHDQLGRHEPLREKIDFAYHLARRPP
jgi:hypothetical protein